MDDTGREQDLGKTSEQPGTGADPQAPHGDVDKGKGSKDGGALASEQHDAAVSIQSIVSPDEYKGSNQSGA